MGSAAAPQFNQLEQIVAMSGYHCFETTGGKARCMKNCTPGTDQTCVMTQWMVETVLKDAAPVANSFYCFSTYMADTGKTKMTVDELGNLQLQYSRKLGIFQCDNWQVFSDGDAELAPGVPFVKVYDAQGDFRLEGHRGGGHLQERRL